MGWARGLYTPFLAWSFYSLPVLLGLLGRRKLEIVALYAAIEVLFRPFRDQASEAWATAGILALLAAGTRFTRFARLLAFLVQKCKY